LTAGDGLLWQRWQEHARSRSEAEALVVWVAGEEPYRWRWGALVRTARAYAGALAARGVKAGQVCALMFRHHRQFCPLYMGVEALGAIPAVLAYPNPRLHPDKFRQGLEGMSQRSGLDWLLTDRALEPMVRPLATKAGSTIREILFPWEWDLAAEKHSGGDGFDPVNQGVTADAPCLLQHSSGTTGLQKAVALSHRAVLEHVTRYAEAIELRADDKVVSWLPLYHDMGLIAAFHLALAAGIPSVQIDPFEWVLAPVLMLEAISRERATVSWLPNFAYNFMAENIHDEDLEGIRLDSLRLLVNCSEPVRAESHERFARRFAALGHRRETLSASYGMAEITFAATQSRPGVETRQLPASREELARGRFRPPIDGEAVRVCVSSGRPLRGCELRIVGPEGDEVPDGTVGEIVIQSVSLFDGYRNYPEKTAEVLVDGWYRSGDLGFRWEGEYYVIGRKKDIIIVAGKNLYPEDIEDAVSRVPGILAGRVVAFGVDDPAAGTEQIWVVAETEGSDPAGLRRLRQAVVEAGMQIDVTIVRVHLVPPRWLIKSSAGKPSRSANRERVLEETGGRRDR
jgi:acyl-CoA synthetase (AMP-forming)/AMP-acid ligase II